MEKRVRPRSARPHFTPDCGFSALEQQHRFVLQSPSINQGQQHRGFQMKKLLFALVATVVAVSVAGCAGMGKGKAPPVVTKG